MAVFVPAPDITSFDDLIEEFGDMLAARYAQVETVLIEAAARRMRRILILEQLGAEAEAQALQQRAMHDLEMERAAALAELRRLAREQAAQIRRDGLAEQIITTAAQAGQAAAAAQLSGVRGLTSRSIGSTAANAIAALTVDLTSKLDLLNSRITRFPDDVYKQVMSDYSPRVILGVQTTRQAQAAAVQTFLAQGIGHINYLRADGSVHMRMPIGSYAEMVGRTSSQRAWQEASIARMQQSGVNLGTIAGSLDACAKCAPWIGAIVSFDGTRGTVALASVAGGSPVTVEVKGTIEDARAAGWGHPNCRDRVVGYLPGATRVPDGVSHDPTAEKERAKQRELEREIRAAKRREASAMNDVDRRRASDDVRDAQANMRDFIDRTGRHRQSAREQLAFAGSDLAAVPPAPRRQAVRLAIDSGSSVGQSARHALTQIRYVHGIPRDTPPVTVRRMPPAAMTARPSVLGSYRRGDGLLWLRPDAEDVEFTAVHEIGHWLDNKLFGTDVEYGSNKLATAGWQRLNDAIIASSPTRYLQAALPRVAADAEHAELMRYLLQPREQFARAYAQWVALRSGDELLLRQLRTFQDAEHLTLRAYQWPADDFDEIATAMDTIFRERGLLK